MYTFLIEPFNEFIHRLRLFEINNLFFNPKRDLYIYNIYLFQFFLFNRSTNLFVGLNSSKFINRRITSPKTTTTCFSIPNEEAHTYMYIYFFNSTVRLIYFWLKKNSIDLVRGLDCSEKNDEGGAGRESRLHGPGGCRGTRSRPYPAAVSWRLKSSVAGSEARTLSAQ